MRLYLKALTIIALSSSNIIGQANIKNAIYLIDITSDYTVKNVSYISQFANNTYVNQPSFIDDRRILVSADEDRDGMTDIIEVNLNDKSYYKVTNTASISEFSPKLDLTKLNINCIVQEGTVQKMYSYPRTRDNVGKKVAELKQPGYFEWLNKDELVYFSVGTPGPNKLVIHNLVTSQEKVVGENIGRAFYKSNDIIYYSVSTNGTYKLVSYEIKTERTFILEELPSQDFIIDNLDFYATKGSGIYKRDNDKSSWNLIIDLKNQQINNLSRLTKKDNKIVVVNTL
jgi:hypothetical protein